MEIQDREGVWHLIEDAKVKDHCVDSFVAKDGSIINWKDVIQARIVDKTTTDVCESAKVFSDWLEHDVE